MKRKDNITARSDFAAKARYHVVYFLCRTAGYLPAWFLYYPLAELLYIILYYVARYRVGVTRGNLAASFPEKSRKELRSIERKFYRHLAEIFVDTIDLTGISRRQLRRRMIIEGEDEHRRSVAGKDWIAALAHYGSWEYFMSYALGDEPGRDTLGVYKTLHSKPMDMFYRRMRSRMNMVPVPVSLFLRHVIQGKRSGMNMGIGLISDQSPEWWYWDKWYDFLGQPTHFYNGMETIALRFGMPVYFMHIEKTGRAHYRGRFECIYDGVEKVEPYEITKRYAAKLEEMIRCRPELWLWSHRRWKHKPPSEEPASFTSQQCPEQQS